MQQSPARGTITGSSRAFVEEPLDQDNLQSELLRQIELKKAAEEERKRKAEEEELREEAKLERQREEMKLEFERETAAKEKKEALSLIHI